MPPKPVDGKWNLFPAAVHIPQVATAWKKWIRDGGRRAINVAALRE
jgi:hypothetical protein